MVQEVFCKTSILNYKAQVVATDIEKCYIYNDAEVPLYPTLVKTIKWC